MPAPHAHDQSPPAGERDSPGRNPRDGGEASHGLTAAEYSVPGTPARFARRTSLHADPDLSVCRGNRGRAFDHTQLRGLARRTHLKEVK